MVQLSPESLSVRDRPSKCPVLLQNKLPAKHPGTMKILRKQFLFVIAVLLTLHPAQANAINVVTSRSSLPFTETLDWGAFGPAFTGVNSGSSLTTQSGLVVTVTQPYYGLQVRQDSPSGGWFGDFLPGQNLLTNWNSPFSVTLSFSSPVFGAGVQIEPGQVQDLPASFTAFVTAYDGTSVVGQFSTTGTRSLSDDGTAPFLGIMSDTGDITSLTYRVSVQTNGPAANDLGMNFLSIETSAPTPEPYNSLLMGTGMVFLAFAGRRNRLRARHRERRPAASTRL